MHTSSMVLHSNTNLGCIKNVESFKELVVSVGGLALVAISLLTVLQLLYMNLIKYIQHFSKLSDIVHFQSTIYKYPTMHLKAIPHFVAECSVIVEFPKLAFDVHR